MKRIFIYGLILAGMLAAPVEKLDVGKLEPVQAVYVSRQAGQVLLETDTEDTGRGNTLEDALTDLEEHCLGIIYLDTAQYLLVAEDAADLLPTLQKILKGSVAVCRWDGQGSVAAAAKYMASHDLGCRLKAWKTGVKLPVLRL